MYIRCLLQCRLKLLSMRFLAPCEQILSKTRQRAKKKGSAINVSSLLSRRSPSFWASHSSQTGLGNARIIFLTTRKSKSSLKYENRRLGVRSRLGLGLKPSPSNGLRILNKDLTRFLQSPFFLVKKDSVSRVGSWVLSTNLR